MNMEQPRKETLNRDLEAALRSVETVLGWENDHVELAKVSEEFSHAVQSTVRLRNRISEARRHTEPLPEQLSLDRVNAIISMMSSIEYPLAGVHWPRIKQVRDSLRQMLS